MLKSTDSSRLNPHVSVDCVIFGYDEGQLKVLLIERNSDKAKGGALNKVLPGNLIQDDEDLDTSAKRVLFELTGLENIYLEQFYAFGNPNRVRKEQDEEWLKVMRAEPQARVITVAYYSLIKISRYKTMPSSFARSAEWVDINKVPKLSFDHNDILKKAIMTLREKVSTHAVGFELLPKKFSFKELQELYEVILGHKLDKRNFRRKMSALNLLIPLAEKQRNVSHKPATLYQFDLKVYRKLMKGIATMD